MTELIITRGLPASGKTTFAKAWVAEDINGRARVNRDDLRQLLHGTATYAHAQEAAVTAAEKAAVISLLEAGRSVILDNTHLRSKYVRGWLEVARDHNATATVQDFPIDVETAIIRDGLRSNPVGSDVIRGMAARFLRKGELPQVPVLAESGAAMYVPKVLSLPAVIVDIDGTVALHGDRSPYDFSRVSEDASNWNVMEVACALRRRGYRLVFCSGRSEECRNETTAWLRHHFGPLFDGPFMRAAGDSRDDAIVKLELFDKHIRNNYDVLCVLDDRNRVVRAWRSIGLTVLQVAEGNF